MDRSQEVLTFWLEECEPQDWYRNSPELDGKITEQFEGLWRSAMRGELDHWGLSAEGALAFLILTDQFPRNMFRGSGQSFVSDPMARATAKRAIERGFDLQIAEPARQFFYLPLEHSECLSDQDRAVRLVATRMESPDTLLHAQAHREIIRQFGRFPFRNDALGRGSTQEEQAFMEAGGYGTLFRTLSEQAA